MIPNQVVSPVSFLYVVAKLRNNFDYPKFLCIFALETSRAVAFGRTRQPSEQRAQSQTCLSFAESRERKGICAQPSYSISATVVSTMWKQHL
jgi:hypothetical protein